MSAKEAHKEIDWTLEVKTTSRDQLIDVSAILAQAIRPDFFYNPIDIPLIVVPGDGSGGKCLVVEAMMKSLLDGHDPENMKHPDARKSMFIERTGGEACDRYCQAFGTVAGAPVMLGFDRVSKSYDTFGDTAQEGLIRAFRRAEQWQKFDPPGPVGAIFRSGVHVNDTEPWIIIKLRTDAGWGGTQSWKRRLGIEVKEGRLKECPRFQEYWRALQDFAKTGKLVDPRRPLNEVEGAFNNAAFHLTHSYLNTKTDPEATLLKFAFENGEDLGASKVIVIRAAIQISVYGDVERMHSFLTWLHERGETAVVEQIFMAGDIATNLGHVLKGDYPLNFEEILASRNDARSIIQKMIKQNRYDLVHGLIDEGRFDLVEKLVELAKEHLTDAGVRRMLDRGFVSRPVKPSILVRLKEAGQEDLIKRIHGELGSEKHPKAREAIEAFSAGQPERLNL